MSPAKTSFEGYSYRTDARFGSRVTISVKNGRVTVTGPRVSPQVYSIWINVQAVILWLLLPWTLIAAKVRNSFKLLLSAVGLALAHLGIGAIGAATLWEGANAGYSVDGGKQDHITFPLSEVKKVRLGRGWARGLVKLAILPYVPGIDQIAARRTVSFEAPDEATGKDVVFAIQLYSDEEAQDLALLLQSESNHSPEQPKS